MNFPKQREGQVDLGQREIKYVVMKKTKKIYQQNTVIYHKQGRAITIYNNCKWYERIWNVLTNPFTYIFKGVLRY